MMTTINSLPSSASIMLRAACKRDNRAQFPPTFANLPNKSFLFTPASLSQTNVDQFQHVTQWQGAYLHPCYLHVVSFPLHLMLMLEKDFPFSLLGLVHIRNDITQYRPIQSDEACVFHCYFKHMSAHPKGIVFSIATDVRVNEELCWSSVSTNLYRNAALSAPKESKYSSSMDARSSCQVKEKRQESWQLGAGLGREYAGASGDFNPIHLSALSAKLFGFKRAIAHGMWSKSRCISALEQITPEYFNQPFNTQVEFIKPAMLPSNVVFSMSGNTRGTTDNIQRGGIEFSLTSQSSKEGSAIPHLRGELTSI